MDGFLTEIFGTQAPSPFHCLDLCYSDPMKKITGEPWQRYFGCPSPLQTQEHKLHWFHCWEFCLYEQNALLRTSTLMRSSFFSLISCMVVFCGTLFDRCWSREGWENFSYIWSQCPKCWRLISILFLLVQSLCLFSMGRKRVGFQSRHCYVLQLFISRNSVWLKTKSSNVRLRCA